MKRQRFPLVQREITDLNINAKQVNISSCTKNVQNFMWQKESPNEQRCASCSLLQLTEEKSQRKKRLAPKSKTNKLRIELESHIYSMLHETKSHVHNENGRVCCLFWMLCFFSYVCCSAVIVYDIILCFSLEDCVEL